VPPPRTSRLNPMIPGMGRFAFLPSFTVSINDDIDDFDSGQS